MGDPIKQLAEDKKRYGVHKCCGRVANGPHSSECGIIDVSAVTRVDVWVAGSGVREFWADSWAASIQDEGRTLKLFADGSGALPETERNEALAKSFEEMAKTVRARAER